MIGDKEVTTRSGLLGYNGKEEANVIIEKFGSVFNLANFVALGNGMKLVEEEPSWGDLVLFEQNGEDTLGVVFNNAVYTSRVGVGVAKFPIGDIKSVWRYV